MNVVFVSSCQKRAVKQTRRILDQYANRISSNTWISPITMEALDEVRALLNKVATRQSSISCFRNAGRQKLKLLWTVGTHKFIDSNGFHMTGSKSANRIGNNINTDIISMSSLAGYTHDLGKATVLFQAKLKGVNNFPVQDPIRHEWVSAIILERIINGATVTNAFEALEWSEHSAKEWNPFHKTLGLKDKYDALLYAVGTHHGLMGTTKNSQNIPMNKLPFNLMRTDFYFKGIDADHPFHNAPGEYYRVAGHLNKQLRSKIENRASRFKFEQSNDPQYLRAVAIISRVNLIMADHTVSSRRTECIGSNLYANTKSNTNGNGRSLDQSLDYHLNNVGDKANDFAYLNQSTVWPGLPQHNVDMIMVPSDPNSRFHWQNDATDVLISARNRSDAPALVMNVAGTGAGKTRMNAKALAALNQRQELRITTALGLRTLTLQTANAYRKELSISKNDLTCIIGDRVIKKLNKSNIDDNPDELVFDVTYNSSNYIPEYLDEYCQIAKNSKALLSPPVLVSTIDYIIAAGEPHKQGHHVLASLRLMNSDLIIDEIDDYSPNSFFAVLRLVEMAAMYGANVVTSSATLPFPMAEQLTRVFASGAAMWSKLRHKQKSEFISVIIDNYQQPKVIISDNYQDSYKAYCKSNRDALKLMKGQKTKVAEIIAKTSSNIDEAFTEIKDCCEIMHHRHSWEYKNTGIKISFGLIRVGFIKNIYALANYLANYLDKEFKDAYIGTYHSDEFTIQRFMKEKILDRILDRKNGNSNIENCEYIESLIQKSNSKEIRFIVIASPVEEVGRDHDFDWGILEPSSARSLVQTAGRINRHRFHKICKPNIAILDKSFSCFNGDCDSEVHYGLMGFETEDDRFPSHSLSEIINLDILNDFTAELRFGESMISKLEDESINQIINYPVDLLTLSHKNKAIWISDVLYKKYPLRERNNSEEFILKDGELFMITIDATKSETTRVVEYTEISAKKNSWLNWSDEELKGFCDRYGINVTEGFKVSLNIYANESPNIEIDKSFGVNKNPAASGGVFR